jgi:crotonobetainyl-CoA:carnitine CoA-transferase CaiB-like acyl-CoA transferase
MRIELEHALAGRVPLIASPMKFSGTPLEHKAPPPTLGQHTDDVLRGVLGFDDAEIARLRANGDI